MNKAEDPPLITMNNNRQFSSNNLVYPYSIINEIKRRKPINY